MANASAFGFSGFDPVGTGLEYAMQNFFQSRMFSKSLSSQLHKNFNYAALYAKNSPTWSVEGLRKANLNPILAATDGAFSSPTVPNANGSMGSFSSSGTSFSAGNPIELLNQYKSGKLLDAQRANVEADTIQKAANTKLTEVKADNESNVGGVGSVWSLGHSLFSRGWNTFTRAFNEFVRDIDKPDSIRDIRRDTKLQHMPTSDWQDGIKVDTRPNAFDLFIDKVKEEKFNDKVKEEKANKFEKRMRKVFDKLKHIRFPSHLNY